jgi:hypothetical protein
MTRIMMDLEPGPDGRPVGELRATGRPRAFAGWLELIRLLEDELRLVSGPDRKIATGDPSSED